MAAGWMMLHLRKLLAEYPMAFLTDREAAIEI
jgi:hypothetical protein